MSNARGFSLVEVMVVVTLIGLFATAASQLSGQWVQRTQITEARGIVERAIGQAKALALRNPEGVFTGATAAICVSEQSISLKSVSAGTVNCDKAGTVVWSANIPKGLSIKTTETSTTVTCIAMLDKKAQFTSNDICSNDTRLTLATESINENFTFN